MRRFYVPGLLAAALAASALPAPALAATPTSQGNHAVNSTPATTYHFAPTKGHRTFYREAGDPAAPTIVLLHGFPTSSHMYRDLIPLLANRFHVIAPDYIGFGQSEACCARPKCGSAWMAGAAGWTTSSSSACGGR